MHRNNRNVRLTIDSFEDRSVPSTSLLFQDVFIPELSAAGEPEVQIREHVFLARPVGAPSGADAPMPQTREHILLAREVGLITNETNANGKVFSGVSVSESASGGVWKTTDGGRTWTL